MKKHSIMTCPFCGRILGILAMKNAFEKVKEIRFNELLRLVHTFKDAKIAPKTLLDHLKPLVKEGFVKRSKKRAQYVTYSLSLDSPLIIKEYAERAEKILNSFYSLNHFRSWTIEALIEKILKLSKFTELELLRLELEKQLPNKSIEDARFQSLIIRNFYTNTRALLLDSMKERTILDYKKSIEFLRENIEASEKQFFG